MEKIKTEIEMLFIRQEENIKWSDIKHFKFEDDDVIEIGFDFQDEFFYATVHRLVEESDEHFAERIELQKNREFELKSERFATYKKLKAEFEALDYLDDLNGYEND